MQQLTGSPREGFAEQRVRDTVNYLSGGSLRWGVNIYDLDGEVRSVFTMIEDTDVEWNEGDIGPGLTVLTNTLRRV